MKIRLFLLAGVAALAGATAAQAEPTVINLCTGSEGFPYHAAGMAIADAAKGSSLIKINVISTNGTVDNMNRTAGSEAAPEAYASGEACHAFIGQPDGPVYLKRTNPALANSLRFVAGLHREYLQVLCNSDSGVGNLADLDNDPVGYGYSINIGPEGSGGWLMWQNFITEDDDYAAVPTKNESNTLALSSVSNGDTTCMMIAAAAINSVMQEANDYYADSINLVDATDGDFDDALDIRGERLYEFTDLPDNYSELACGWGCSYDTLSWQAGVYANRGRFPNDNALAEFTKFVNRAKAGIQAEFGK